MKGFSLKWICNGMPLNCKIESGICESDWFSIMPVIQSCLSKPPPGEQKDVSPLHQRPHYLRYPVFSLKSFTV